MKETGAAVVERTDLDDLLEKAKKGIQPPGLDPISECPYCHKGRLERREIRQEREWRAVRIGGAEPPVVLLVFWVCMNEACCLMFWRLPRVSERPARRHDGSTPRGMRH